MGKLQKLDNRIQTILQNGIRDRHRTVFVMIGNKGQDQVPIMHQILNSLFNKGRLSLLWCYKKELSFSTHRKKNLKLLNKKRKAGLTSDATIFEQFICTTDIRWCYYHETHRILGQTFDMCILQDFEALTPNTLARTIETVSGGGLIVFLLKSMNSLRQLCTMVMDVHSRYRTDAHQDVVCRFNERFLLSLTNNPRCLILDDRWEVLPLSKKVLNSLRSNDKSNLSNLPSHEQQELQKLKVSLVEDGSPFAPLVKICVTLDQARSLVQFCASLSSTNQNTSINAPRSILDTASTQNYPNPGVQSSSAVVVVTAGRGRGKSAALGLGLAAAFEAGLPNLYVTAPSAENLTTLMQFTMRGLAAFGYEEHQDYAIIKSDDPELRHVVVRIDVHRQSAYRQSLIYLPPGQLASHMSSSHGASQADLVCVDEAAAIPLPLVRLFITGPRLVYMASTINGYEGTGRSLSLKLIKQLRTECTLSEISMKLETSNTLPVAGGHSESKSFPKTMQLGKSFRSADKSRMLYEVTLTEAIRYANGDPVEAWLTELLCLDCGTSLLSIDNPNAYYPPVDQCQLYYVNRDTLFAYHKSTEVFLHRLMALYVASHYKNSPNDLQLLSDAPAHHIFCLLAPYNSDSGKVPEILCVLQVCMEGRINKERVMRSLGRGLRPSGDLIPWTISQQFSDPKFGELSGARVVRIATHPEYQHLGYGTRALNLLHDYYAGKVCTKPTSSDESGISIEPKDSLMNLEQRETLKDSTDQIEDDGDLNDDDEDDDGEEELIEEISDDEPMDIEQASLNRTAELLNEKFERRGPSSLPPLLSRLNERSAEQLDYVGVSFGATPNLVRFWKRSGYMPVYLRQTLNELTGEFTCIMLKQLGKHYRTDYYDKWLSDYNRDFNQRFIRLLPGCFRHLDATYAFELITHRLAQQPTDTELSASEVSSLFTSVDLDRLSSYTRSLIDYHVISDLLPHLAQIYFANRLPNARLNKTQQVILLGLGLQHKTVDRLASEFDRLLGEGSTKLKNCPTDEAGLILAHVDENALIKTDGGGTLPIQPSLVESNKDKSGRITSRAGAEPVVNAGWNKRIRGLLFVVVRELVRSLQDIVGTTGEMEKLPTKLVASSVDGHVSYTLDDDENATEDNEEDDESDSDKSADGQSELMDETEKERRAGLVRQLLSEELSSGSGPLGSLNLYKVHGSESDWAQAVVGHGSDFSSLNVKLPSTVKSNTQDKSKRRKSTNDSHSSGKKLKKHKKARRSVATS